MTTTPGPATASAMDNGAANDETKRCQCARNDGECQGCAKCGGCRCCQTAALEYAIPGDGRWMLPGNMDGYPGPH